MILTREKHRWILFEIISKNSLPSKDSLIRILRKKAYELYGSFCAPKFRLVVYDTRRGIGILCCPKDQLNKLRVVLAFTRELDGSSLFINDLYCSGTLKKLKEKTSSIRLFSENSSLGDPR